MINGDLSFRKMRNEPGKRAASVYLEIRRIDIRTLSELQLECSQLR